MYNSGRFFRGMEAMPQKTVRLFQKPQSLSLLCVFFPCAHYRRNSQADRFDLPTRRLLLGQAYLRGDGELPPHYHPHSPYPTPHVHASASLKIGTNCLVRSDFIGLLS